MNMLFGWIVSIVGVAIGASILEPLARKISLGRSTLDGSAITWSFVLGSLTSFIALSVALSQGADWLSSIFFAPLATVFIYTIGIRSIDSEADLPKA